MKVLRKDLAAMPIISEVPLSLNIAEIVNYHGLRCRGLVRPKSVELLSSLIEDISQQSLIKPEVAYKVIKIEQIKSGCLILNDRQALPAPIAAHRLRKASHLFVGVCTLGDKIAGAIAQSFRDKKSFRAVLMEEVTNFALFKLSEVLEAEADKYSTQCGLTASGPLNPGDEGFELSAQQLILDIVDAAKIGVAITPTLMMKPQHSISVVFGLGKKMPKWSRLQSCEDCRSRERCKHRLALEVLASEKIA